LPAKVINRATVELCEREREREREKERKREREGRDERKESN